MKNKMLSLFKSDKAHYISVFRNNHGRVIYLSIIRTGERIEIVECEYLDRTKAMMPKRLVTHNCALDELLDVIREELDRDFAEVEFCDDVIISKDYLVSSFMGKRKKKILIMIAEGNMLRTILKNKYHRTILFELTLDDRGAATITQCHYIDKRAKGKKISPQGLVTVRFEFSLRKLLEVVNSELEGGFTDAIITREHTLTLDRPVCGAI